MVGLTDFMTLHDLPYGTLIRHANKLYFKSRGLDHDILTGTDGMWHFLHEGICSKWKTWYIVYTPPQCGEDVSKYSPENQETLEGIGWAGEEGVGWHHYV